MIMLEDCIDKISKREELSQDTDTKELYKSIYYHLCDYKDILDKSIDLTNEIKQVSERWELVRKANEN